MKKIFFIVLALIFVNAEKDDIKSQNFIKAAHQNHEKPVNEKSYSLLYKEDDRWQEARIKYTGTTNKVLLQLDQLMVKSAQKCHSYETENLVLTSLASEIVNAQRIFDKKYLEISKPGLHLVASAFNVPENFKIKSEKHLTKNCEESKKHLANEYLDLHDKTLKCIKSGVDVGVATSNEWTVKLNGWLEKIKSVYDSVDCSNGEGELIETTVSSIIGEIHSSQKDVLNQLETALLETGGCSAEISESADKKFDDVMKTDSTCQ